MLRADGISVRAGEFSLRNLEFDVKDGEYFVLLGASGSGKTLLLETLAGIRSPDSGRISLNGKDVTEEMTQTREIALVQQEQVLFPHMTVAANLGYGPRARGKRSAEVAKIVESLAEEVGIAKLLSRKPRSLSGGEAQRASLARALATKPQCLLLDEPLSALDSKSRSEMRGLLRALHRKGQTILHVTHDYEEAISLADRVAVMEGGGIAQIGSASEIFQHPKSEFVARFVGIKNFFHGELTAASESGHAMLFTTPGLTFSVLTEAKPGKGYFILRSEDVTLSDEAPRGSAQNCFEGTVTDVAGAALGVEVVVDVGAEVASLVTEAAVESLGLQPGKRVWMSFKATAGRFLEE